MKKLIFSLLIGILIISSCKKSTTSVTDPRPNDIDGNVYDTVKIGTQVWMKQNLKTTRYNDGTPITTGLITTDWPAATTGAYAIYNNSDSIHAIYGKLYNWYAVNTGKLAPSGWHVPTYAEWLTLVAYLGTEPLAGGVMKESGTSHWAVPNTGATNSSGFSGLPCGYLTDHYYSIGYDGWFWSSTESGSPKAWSCILDYSNTSAIVIDKIKAYGFSVRCIRD